MCLYTNQVTPEIAKSDITVYKIMRVKKGLFGKKYYSLYYNFRWRNLKKPLKAKGDPKITLEYPQTRISKGYIHTYAHLRDAKSMAEFLNHTFNLRLLDENETAVVFECVIPKGTKYFYGMFAADASYASRKIKFVKIVE